MKKRKSDLKYCENEYNHRHNWERQGIDGRYLYYKCSQCGKWMREKIKYVIGGK